MVSVAAAVDQGIWGKGIALIEVLRHQLHRFVFHTLVLYPWNQLIDFSDNAIGWPGYFAELLTGNWTRFSNVSSSTDSARGKHLNEIYLALLEQSQRRAIS